MLSPLPGLPPSGSWQDLKDHMREAGDVCFADVQRDGEGVVEFVRREDMEYALRRLDRTEFRSHQVSTPLHGKTRHMSAFASQIKLIQAHEGKRVVFHLLCLSGGDGEHSCPRRAWCQLRSLAVSLQIPPRAWLLTTLPKQRVPSTALSVTPTPPCVPP